MLARLVLCSLAASLALACGPDSPRARSVAATPAPAPVEAPDAPEEEAGRAEVAPEEPPAYGEGRLDAMREAELEAACMQGSTAACDRLGH